MLVVVSCCLSAAAQSGLPTPNPISPNGPSPLFPEFKWSAVPGAEFYIIRLWTEDNPSCPGRNEPSQMTAKGNPHTFFYGYDVCDANTCGVVYKFLTNRVTKPVSSVTGQPVLFPQQLTSKGAEEAALKEGGSMAVGAVLPYPILPFARACGNPDGRTHNGRLYVWKWSVQAVAALNEKASEWGKKSPQSQPMSYWHDESQPSRPAPEPKPHP